MYKAIIFDLDGTLLDTISDLTSCLNAALEEMNQKGYTDEQAMTFVGNGIRHMMDLALNERASNQEIDSLLERFNAHYADKYNEKTKLYPHMEEVVYKVKEHGYALGVCSNKANEFVQQLIANHFKKDTFDFVLGEVDFIERKPAPDMALEVAANLGVSPKECLFVGDSSIDIRTAKAAKMPIIAVTYGFHSEERLLAEKPEYVAHSALELLEIIEAFR